MTAVGLFATNPPVKPTWWTDTGNSTAILAANTSPNNAALANVGQLKFVAYQARSYLNLQLSTVGGAGPEIDAVVNEFAQNTSDNYALANLGQLKYLAEPFYDRLLQVGYNTNTNLNYRISGNLSSTSWTSNYPWPTPPARPGQIGYNGTTYDAWLDQNYAPVNLGQLKLTFSFDLLYNFSLSAIANAYASGLPNTWLTASGLYPFYGSSGASGNSSTTYSYLDEYGTTLGHDPDSSDDSTVALLVFKPLQ